MVEDMRRKLCLAVALAMLQLDAAVAIAEPNVPCPPGKLPDWDQLPGPDDFGKFYPSKTDLALQQGGRVVLSCVAGGSGSLEQCKVASESPSGIGLGDYALKLARRFKLRRPGCPAAGVRFDIPISFKSSGD